MILSSLKVFSNIAKKTQPGLIVKRKNSPCIDICQFSGKNGWCKGCGRTREEARKWRSMKPFAKTAILRDLTRRIAIITGEN